MGTIHYLLLLGTTLLMNTCQPQQNNEINQSEAKPIWQDEFDGNGMPDTTKWSYDVGGHGWGNQELQYLSLIHI